MQIKSLACLLTLGLSRALNITKNTNVTQSLLKIDEDLIIDKDVYYSLLNTGMVTVDEGVVLINGAWHIVADNGETSIVRTLSSSFINNGIFQFNNFQGGEWSNFYTITYDWQNHGDMYFGFNKDQKNPAVSITSKGQFNNTGMMVFRQDGYTSKEVQLLNDGYGNTIHNTGSICLYNINFSQKANFEGSGCIYLAEGTSFEIDFTAGKHNYDFDIEQTLTMSVNTMLYLVGLGSYSGKVQKKFLLSGYGKGRSIRVDFEVQDFKYDNDAGELTIYHQDGSTITFVIGSGYNIDQFEIPAKKNGITYTGLPPNLAYDCRCQKEFPEPHVVPDDDDTCVCEPHDLAEKISKAIALLQDNGYEVTRT